MLARWPQAPRLQRDWSHRAAYQGRSATDVVGTPSPRGVPPSPAWAFRHRRLLGRPGVLRAVRGLLRPVLRPAVDPDRDLLAAHAPAVPLPSRLRDAMWRGSRLAFVAALLPDRSL